MATKIAVLISGSGSNLQAIIDAVASGHIDAEIVGVLSNKANAYGLTRAENANIPTAVISHHDYDGREAFDAAMQTQLQAWNSEIVVLAGFMRILTGNFVRKWHGKMLNVHPSLLPKYRGLNTHQRAIDAGDKIAGSSIHFVTEELDGGPIVLQASVAISAGDSADSLASKVQQQEHRYYPDVIAWLCSRELELGNEGLVFQKTPLKQPIIK